MLRKKVQQAIPALKIENYRVEDDIQLMATVAVENSTTDQQPDTNHSILMFHASTSTASALIDTEYKIRHVLCLNDRGGMFSLGDSFLHYLGFFTEDITEHKDNQSVFEEGLKNMPAVASAVYKALRSCPGCSSSAPHMYSQLVKGDESSNILGSLVALIALIADSEEDWPSKAISTLVYDHATAKREAVAMVNASIDNLLTKIITFHASLIKNFQSDSDKEKISNPQVVLLGEHVHLLTGQDSSDNEETFRANGLNRLSQIEYTSPLYFKLRAGSFLPDALRQSEFQPWLNEHILPLIEKAKVIPREKFFHYLHRGAVKRLAVLSGKA